MPTSTRQIVGEWDSAALVRGQRPVRSLQAYPAAGASDYDPAAVAFHEQATSAVREILFRDAEKVRPTL